MTLSFNFAGIENMQLGGAAPPEGAYLVEIIESATAPVKSGNGHNLVIKYRVLAGEHVNKTTTIWYPVPNDNTAPDTVKFMMSKIRRMLVSHGVAEAQLQGDFSFEETELVGAQSVIFVQDAGEKDGKRQTNVMNVLPEDKAGALAGTWTPGGGNAKAGNGAAAGAVAGSMAAGIGGMQAQATAQAQQAAQAFNPTQTPPTGGAPIGQMQQQPVAPAGAQLGAAFNK